MDPRRLTLPADDPLAVAVADAIHAGDVGALQALLREHSSLATAAVVDECGNERTLLHVLADWPGMRPNGGATVGALIGAGADPNAPFVGPHRETPLHWAASNDDVALLDALLAAGADIEATGSVIADGTPLADAVAFGQWQTARRLIEHGARANLWQAAALGLIDRVEERYAASPALEAEDTTQAFWCACHGGQRVTAEYLLDHGADINWVGYDDLTPLDAAERSEAAELAAWLRERGARSATPG